MKILSATLRPSPCAAFLLLLAIVVSSALADTEDHRDLEEHKNLYGEYSVDGYKVNLKNTKEVQNQQNYEDSLSKQSSLQEKFSDSRQPSNFRGSQVSQQENSNNYNRNVKRNVGLENLGKSQSDYAEDLSEADNEKESDGYGYDDDDYYHINYKRNDVLSKNHQLSKISEETNNKMEREEGIQKSGDCKNPNKETETIECIDFKETRLPSPGTSDTVQLPNAKPHNYENPEKKNSMDEIQINEINESPAVEGKSKDVKKESNSGGNSGSTSSKVAEPQKENKLSDEKESLKSKNNKIVEEPEKKDKSVSLKSSKVSVVSKNSKETAKNVGEKEKINHDLKNAKLSVGSKLVSNEESLKNKDVQNQKFLKENKENFKSNDKINPDFSNINKLSKITDKANFVSSDFKDNMEAGKISEKKSELLSKKDENVGLKSKGVLVERTGNTGMTERRKSAGMENQEDVAALAPEISKTNFYFPFSASTELRGKNLKDSFKKRESKKEKSKSDQTGDVAGLNKDILYRFQIPQKDIENTEYHKNFIKSLRKYKALEENQKMLSSVSPFHKVVSDKNLYDYTDGKEIKKNKRFKSVKRRLSEEIRNQKENIKSINLNSKRNAVKYDFAKKPQRERRDSPKKVEYEIKIINEKPVDRKNTQFAKLKQSRKKKNVDSVLLKNVPVYTQSQVASNYFPRLGYSEREDKKFKRTLSVKKEKKRLASNFEGDKTHVKVRGAPAGYYSNRVKFGQKHFTQIPERQSGDFFFDTNSLYFDNPPLAPKLDPTRPVGSYDNYLIPQYYEKIPSPVPYPNRFQSLLEKGQGIFNSGKNFFRNSWETPIEYNKHAPMKRYDEVSKQLEPNSLFLMRKDHNGEHLAKTFVEATNKKDTESLDSDQLARMLSKDNDYVVLKKTDQNQYQEVLGDLLPISLEGDTLSLGKKKLDLVEIGKLHSGKISNKQGLSSEKDIFSRSYLPEDKRKYSEFQDVGTKFELQKTLDKYKDVPNFFREGKQELLRNENAEVKEASDIVFSEDKIPEPIVVSNEGKSGVLKPKNSQNSIFAISSNFKALDQNRKESPKECEASRDFPSSEAKVDTLESTWMSLLKNAFPEAKTVTKNGNEVLVLGIDHSSPKGEEKGRCMPLKTSKSTPPGSGCESPSALSGDRQNKIVSNDEIVPSPITKALDEEPKNRLKESTLEVDRSTGSLVINGGDCQIQIPLNQLAYFSQMFKNLNEKKSATISEPVKILRKKNANWYADHEMSPKYNAFVKDLNELTKIDQEAFNNEAMPNTENQNFDPLLSNENYSELNKYTNTEGERLGNPVQSLLPKDNFEIDEKILPVEMKNPVLFKDSENGYEKSNYWQSESNFPSNTPNQWTTVEDNYRKPLSTDNSEVPNEMQEEVNNLLHGEGLRGASKSNYQNQLWYELSAASDKIQRLRREGVGKRKLRKTIEEAIAFRGRRQSENNKFHSPSNTKEKNLIGNSNKVKLKSDSEQAIKDDDFLKEKNDKENILQLKSSLKQKQNLVEEFKVHQTPTHFKPDRSTKDDAGSSALIKNRMNAKTKSNENGVRRRKKRHIYRRSPSPSFKSKVSTSEVQNKILKNLPEDIYESVSSPGMRRKLLSIEDEEEDDEKYLKEVEVADGGQPDCVRNAMRKCIDPMILELFEDDADVKNTRARRNAFHSNYKREIDLDESMPNDFQNFLVTSLGGLEGQKREVVKKDEAFWEGKEGNQDNFNQMVESSPAGKDNEDSLLEKREVSINKKIGRGNLKQKSNFLESEKQSPTSNLADVMEVINRPLKKNRYRGSNPEKRYSKEYGDDKAPTQIRIQITNGSAKEKKSSDLIMDENENNANDLGSVIKDGKFLDQNKLNSAHMKPQSFHHFPKSVYSYSIDSEDGESFSRYNNKNPYFPSYSHNRLRRKKKKYVQDSFVKPGKDLSAFEQKSMESLLKKCFKDQPGSSGLAGATTQKMPVANHLPQVETVYNPTQGTNKAQLQAYRPSKPNSLNTKTNVNTKNPFHANDMSSMDEGGLSSLFKDNHGKSKNKGSEKEFEGLIMKQNLRKTKFRQEPNHLASNYINLNNLKNFQGAAASSGQSPNNPNARLVNLFTQPKWYQTPYPSYLYQNPTSNMLTTNSLYDNLKFKQDFQPYGTLARDRISPKALPQYTLTENFPSRQEGKIKSRTGFEVPADNSWNAYDYYFNKKPVIQKYGSGQMQNSNRNKMGHRLSKYNYAKPLADEKQILYNIQPEADYISPDDEDYMDDYTNQPDFISDDSIIEAISVKKPAKSQVNPPGGKSFAYKNTDFMAEEEDPGEDYDETIDEDDLEDYTFLSPASSRGVSKIGRGKDKFLQGAFQSENAFRPKLNAFRPRTDRQGITHQRSGYKTGRNEEKFMSAKERFSLNEAKLSRDGLDGSLAALKKANEKSNIFGRNLYKNLNQLGYDEHSKENAKRRNIKSLRNDRKSENIVKSQKQKTAIKSNVQNKLKRYSKPVKNRRFYYVSKTETYDANELKPGHTPEENFKYSNNQISYYRLPKPNPLNAELRGTENEFEYESEENGNHFNGNLINNGKFNLSQKKIEISEDLNQSEKKKRGTQKRDNEDDDNSEDVEDVKENLEDDGETISEDNVLENVIGKYIMRKSIKPATDSKLKQNEMASFSVDNVEGFKNHKTKKRSIRPQFYSDEVANVKSVRKRLTSGHLTESNFRKFHKKNKKHTATEDNDKFFEDVRKELDEVRDDKGKAVKRSALDIFRKFTKEKEMKKMNQFDPHTAGFEPLLAANENKFEKNKNEEKSFDRKVDVSKSNFEESKLNYHSSGKNKHDKHEEKVSTSEKKFKSDRTKNFEIKLHANVEDVTDEEEDRKSKQDSGESKVENGPWKVELNEKIEEASPDEKKAGNLAQGSSFANENNPESPKTYLVVPKTVTALIANINRESKGHGFDGPEVKIGDSFWHSIEVNPKHMWKRYSAFPEGWQDVGDEKGRRTNAVMVRKPEVKGTEPSGDAEVANEGKDKEPPSKLQTNYQNSGFDAEEKESRYSDESVSSKGRFSNRKSIFPLSSDANIIRDSSHLNDETSKYLGQQIVGAIFSHVSSQPKFKELIAPGLANKKPCNRKEPDGKKRALNKEELSEQVQSILQRVMFDIEKVAEKHVKRRMCNKIDKEAKVFLQSLVHLPSVKSTQKLCPEENICLSFNHCSPTESPVNVAMSSSILKAQAPAPQSSVPQVSVAQPSVAHSSMAQTLVAQPSVGQPLVVQPSVAHTLVGQSSVGQPFMDQPSVGQPSMGQPSMDQPSMDQPSMGQPSIGQPSMDQPSMGQPSMDQPSVGQSSMDQPSVGQSSMDQPSVGQFSMDQPSVGQTSMDQPSVGQSSMDQPSVGQIFMGQPSVGQSYVGQFSVGQPSVGQPSVGQPYVAQSYVVQSPAQQYSVVEPQPKYSNYQNVKDKQFENLMKKQQILAKLVDSYESLSNLEKQNLDINFMNFKQELDQTNKMINNYKMSTPYFDAFHTATSNKSKVFNSEVGFEAVQNNKEIPPPPPKTLLASNNSANESKFATVYYVTKPQKDVTSEDKRPSHTQSAVEMDFSVQDVHSIQQQQSRKQQQPLQHQPQQQPQQQPLQHQPQQQPPKQQQQQQPPKQQQQQQSLKQQPLKLKPLKQQPLKQPLKQEKQQQSQQQEHTETAPKCTKTNETGSSSNSTTCSPYPVSHATDTTNLDIMSSTDFKSSSSQTTADSPERFDLLPLDSADDEFDTGDSPERVRTKQYLRDTNKCNKPYIFKYHNCQSSTPSSLVSSHKELHKLGLGDAAKLQAWSKSRGPWVSNLDTKKSTKYPSCNFSDPVHEKSHGIHISRSKQKHLANKKTYSLPLNDRLQMEEDIENDMNMVPDDGSYVTDIKSFDYTGVPGYYYRKPILPYRLDKKFYTRKDKPFHSVYRNEAENRMQNMPMQYFLRKYRLPQPKQSYDLPRLELCKPGSRGKRSTRSRLVRRKILTQASETNKKLMAANIKSDDGKNDDRFELEEDPAMEYLIWSSMPPIRRRLNNMEINFNPDYSLPNSHRFVEKQENKYKK